MGAEPRPASFENMPLPIPRFIAEEIVMPAVPPKVASGENAELNIRRKVLPVFSILEKITTRADTMYKSAITGTSVSVTLPMRFMPPIITTAEKTATIMPIIRFDFCISMGVKRDTVPEMEFAMVFICVMLPMPKDASMPKRANKLPSQAHLFPIPFDM